MAGGDQWSHDRQDLARDLWLNGQTYQQIADTFDSFVEDQSQRKTLYASAGAARNGVMAAIRRHAANETRTDEPDPEPSGPEPVLEPANVIRARISQQWDMIVNHNMPKAMEGDEAAAGIVARALQSQARLYGVNLKPASVPEEKPGGESPVDEVADRRRRRRERRHASG